MPMNVLVTSGSPIRSRSVLTVLLLAGSIAATAGGSANAGSQAVNGRIAYVSDAACRFDPNLKNDDIFSMAPDGSGKADLTRSVNPDAAPAWSADGTRLALTRPGKANNDDVWVMSSNGKGQKNVTNTSPDDGNPDWSPDGTKIAYDVSQTQVFEANQDGTGIRALVPGGYEAAWSSTGKIAYSATVEPSNAEIFVANADGSGAHNVTNAPGYDDDSAAWSPDGTKIAFVRFFGGAGEIFVMNADGSGQTDLTNSPANDGDPSWSPDGTKIAFGCGDNTLRAIDASDGKQVLFQGAHNDWVLGTAFSKDSRFLASVCRDGTMKLTEVATQRFLDNVTSITPGALKGGLLAVALNPVKRDQKVNVSAVGIDKSDKWYDELLIGGSDGTPRLYKMHRETKRVIGDDANKVREYAPMQGRIFSVAFSKDGSQFVAGSSLDGTGEVRVYKTGNGDIVSKFEGQPGPVFSVAYAPDGKAVAAAGFDGTVRLIDAATGKLIKEFVPVPLKAAEAQTKTP
jgi:Tol biopolymer transport system component